ncbi:MAG: hypothetical protein QOD77_2086 [Thermoplasmata archaeon]|jgi:hypothetical protein|nr:hypothetical protein [Thermoplasmata archaeon]
MERIPDVSRLVPRRADVESREEANGRVTVVRVRYGPVRRRVLGVFGIPPTLTIHLDPLGSAAWRLIDGRRTAGDIKAQLQGKFPGEADLAARLGKFLGAMVSRGFVELG